MSEKKIVSVTVTASVYPIPVADLLQKEVCLYSDCQATTPKTTITIGEVLEAIKDGKKMPESRKEIFDAIDNDPDKGKRHELEKGLPALMFGSEPQTERKAAACKANGILCLHFVGIPPDELESEKKEIGRRDYVFAVFLSASGRELDALIAYADESDREALIAALQEEFRYEIDKTCSDICRLQPVTWDENLIRHDDVYPAILTESDVPNEVQSSEPVKSCGIDVLDKILSNIEPIDWKPYRTVGDDGKTKSPSDRTYILRSIEQTLASADKIGAPFVNHFGTIYFSIGTHYTEIVEMGLKELLIESAIKCGVPPDVAVYQNFVDKIFKQFLINTARHSSGVIRHVLATAPTPSGRNYATQTLPQKMVPMVPIIPYSLTRFKLPPRKMVPMVPMVPQFPKTDGTNGMNGTKIWSKDNFHCRFYLSGVQVTESFGKSDDKTYDHVGGKCRRFGL